MPPLQTEGAFVQELQSAFKRKLIPFGGQKGVSNRKHNHSPTCDLVGGSCQIGITIEGKTCTALLDCGSMVTTIGKPFFDRELSHLTLQPLSRLVDIEGAGGQSVTLKLR